MPPHLNPRPKLPPPPAHEQSTGPHTSRHLGAAAGLPSTVKQRNTSFWLLTTRGLDDSTGTQICSKGQRTAVTGMLLSSKGSAGVEGRTLIRSLVLVASTSPTAGQVTPALPHGAAEMHFPPRSEALRSPGENVLAPSLCLPYQQPGHSLLPPLRTG